MTKDILPNIDDFLKKVEEAKKKDKMDLSSDQDLSIAVMNLVSLEEHFFFTAAKTGKNEYYDLLSQVREMRKSLLKKLVKNPEGEIWCISKHLLAASMRLTEVGTKYLGQGNKKEAEDLFNKAYQLYSLFWGVNLKIIDVSQVKKVDDDKLNTQDKGKTDFLGKLGDLVKKVVDCCIE